MNISKKNLIALVLLIFGISLFTNFLERLVFDRDRAKSCKNFCPVPLASLENKTPANKQKFRIELMPQASRMAIPAVVHIELARSDPSKVKHRKYGLSIYKPLVKHYQTLGSGVIINPKGYILTNNHVIENMAGHIRVNTIDGKSYKAKIIGRDPKTDLAVIKINANNLSYIQFGNSDDVEVGDIALALGNPFGIGETVTMGIISATGRNNIGIVDYENFLQTDAAINPGNSGGPLVNLQGELIGINTAILTKSGGYEGISFSIPSNTAKKVLRDLMLKGKVERSWLGVAIQDMNKETAAILRYKGEKGVVVMDSVEGSPAKLAGLKRGDVITTVNGNPIENKGHLKNLIAENAIGSQLELNIIRFGRSKKIQVKLSKMPEDIKFFDVRNFKCPCR